MLQKEILVYNLVRFNILRTSEILKSKFTLKIVINLK